jgi:hypothetical protein
MGTEGSFLWGKARAQVHHSLPSSVEVKEK